MVDGAQPAGRDKWNEDKTRRKDTATPMKGEGSIDLLSSFFGDVWEAGEMVAPGTARLCRICWSVTGLRSYKLAAMIDSGRYTAG